MSVDEADCSHLQRHLDAPALTDGQRLGEQCLDRLDGAELAALDELHEVMEHLKGAGHAQGNEMLANLLDRGSRYPASAIAGRFRR